MLDLSQPNLLNQTSLPFRDARGCKEWLATLPLTDGAHAHGAVAEVIDSLNLTEIAGYERLKIMELLRDKVAFLQESLAGTFAGKPLPLSNDALDQWESAESLWAGMEQGYRYCLRAAANDDAETARHFALVVERCLRYTGLQMLSHGFVHSEVPARLLQDLHALFQFAEKRGVAHVPVKDSIDGHRGVASAAQAYVRALLVDAAYPAMLNANELIAVDALMKKWATKVVISRIPPEGEPAALRCTDLAGDRGLHPPAGKPVQGETLIYLDLKSLSESLRRRIRKLGAGATWSELNLPKAFGQVAVTNLLSHVHRFWCEARPNEPLPQPVRDKCDVISGFEAFYQCLAGKPFEAPRQSDDLGALQAEQMAVFGKVTTRAAVDVKAAASPVEIWKLEGASADRLRLRRPPGGTILLGLQQLIGYRGAAMAGYGLAVVRGLTEQHGLGLVVDATPIAGRPEVVIFRSKETAFSPALRLPAADESAPAGLLVPQGTFQPGRVVELRTDAIQMVRLTSLIQRGANFEWVTVEPLSG